MHIHYHKSVGISSAVRSALYRTKKIVIFFKSKPRPKKITADSSIKKKIEKCWSYYDITEAEII